MTTTQYEVIYADPPWQYRDKLNNGRRGASHKYPTMSDKELMELPVANIATADAHLFLWATSPRLFIAEKLMKSWGFTYKTVAFVWAKQNRKSPTWQIGLGHYTRSCVEMCLVGVRGRPRRVSRSVSQLVVAPVSGHSAKPGEVRDRIVELCGDVPRVELFARVPVDGWDSIGNEIDGRSIEDVLQG